MGIKDNMKQAFIELKHDLPMQDDNVPVKTMDAQDVSIVTPSTVSVPLLNRVSSTLISEETTLWGNLNSNGNVELRGSMKGNVEAKGNVIVTGGRVLGNITGASVQLLSALVQGNVMATGRITLDADSAVMGDIHAETVSIDGRVRGDLKVEKHTCLLANALLMGNVDTHVISMNEGARVLGSIMVDQNNASTTVFPEVEI